MPCKNLCIPAMDTPLVSIVIPTHNRPQLLWRAIDSALGTVPDGDVEVIVVPNGPDTSWRSVATNYAKNPRILWQPIETAHGNVARNQGMALAKGKYIRFLDDDDYLLPGSVEQVGAIERTQAEICSGLLANVDQTGRNLGQVGFPLTKDFLCAAVYVSGFTLPTGNLILRKAIADCRWDINVNRAQDHAWMIDLAAFREWRWVHVDAEVGVWFQHNLARTSSTTRMTGREEAIICRLLNLHRRIAIEGRSSPERDHAIADSLWYYVHRGFPNHPLYWTRIGMRASAISRKGRPHHIYFQKGIFAATPPLISEWALFPMRLASQLIKSTREARGTCEYRRKL